MKQILVIFLLLTSMVFQAQSQTVSPETTGPIPLDATVAKCSLIVRLKVTGQIRDKDSLPYYVRFNNREEQQLIGAIKAYMDDRRMMMTVDMTKLRQPGNYEAVFQLMPASGDPILVSVPLTRPSAVLDTVKTIKVSIVGGEIESQDPFMVRETGKLSRVVEITSISQVIPNQPNNPLFRFDDQPVSIAAGIMASKSIKLDSEEMKKLPLGITVGRWEVTSPEASKILVPFVISKRRSYNWLWGTLLVGLVVGFLVRIYFSNRKAVEEQKFLASQLLQRIDRETAKIGDKKLLDAVAQITQLLRALLLGNAPGTLKPRMAADYAAEIQTVTTKYNAEQADFAQRLQLAKQKFTTFADIFANVASYDPAMINLLKKATGMYDNARKYLEVLNAEKAQSELDNIEKDLTQGLADAIKNLKDRFSVLPALFPAVTPDDLKKQLTDTATDQKGKLDLLLMPVTTPQMLFGLIKDIDQVLTSSRPIILTSVSAIEKKYTSLYQPGIPEMEELKLKFEAWKQHILDLVEQPLLRYNKVMVTELDTAWTAAKPKGRDLGDAREFMRLSLDTVAKKYGLSQVFDFPYVTNTIEAAGRRAKFWFWFFEILQSLLVFLLIMLLAYKSYAPGFFGTDEELLTIFFFAFGLDITVATLVQMKPR